MEGRWKLVRAMLLLVGGLVGLAFEAKRGGGPRVELLVFYGGMMGLPPFLNFDEWLRNRGNGASNGSNDKGPGPRPPSGRRGR